MANSIYNRNEYSVCDRVCALNRAPGVVLRCSVLLLFSRMPSDGRRVKQHLSTLQRGEASSFGIPLIPADECADGARLTALQDRKSTRLNSSHRTISYAVFCLKKKKFIIDSSPQF